MEWLNENGDTAKKYVLPDGYIYAWMQKTVTVTHNANDGTGYKNARPKTNGTMIENSTSNATGQFCTSPIEIVNPQTGIKNEILVTVSSSDTSKLSKIVQVYYSPMFVFYYDETGGYVGSYSLYQLGMGDAQEKSLPFTFAIDHGNVGTANWNKTKYVRVSLGIKNDGTTIGDDDIAPLVINVHHLDKEVTSYGWYSTGVQHSNDKATQQNSADIAVLNERTGKLETDVAALQEAVLKSPSNSGAVWYAVGDSITKGYGVGADNCWVKYVMQYNGYDAGKSKNLGISGLGFAKTDPNYSKTARTVVDENDFSAVDLVTIAVGINDWKEPFSIDTVKSEMGYCFTKILTDNPYCKIIFIVPFNIWLKGSAATNWALGYSGSDVTGGTLQNFIDTQVSVCEEYGIQVIDMTKNSVINKTNIETVLYDKIHPDEACHKALGKELSRRILFA